MHIVEAKHQRRVGGWVESKEEWRSFLAGLYQPGDPSGRTDKQLRRRGSGKR